MLFIRMKDSKYLCDDNSRSKKHWNILSLCMSATGALSVSIWPRLQKSEEKRPRDCPFPSFLLNGVYWVNCLWGYRPPSPTNTTYFLDDPLYWNYSNIPQCRMAPYRFWLHCVKKCVGIKGWMKRSNIIEAIEHESKTSIYAQLLPSCTSMY